MSVYRISRGVSSRFFSNEKMKEVMKLPLFEFLMIVIAISIIDLIINATKK